MRARKEREEDIPSPPGKNGNHLGGLELARQSGGVLREDPRKLHSPRGVAPFPGQGWSSQKKEKGASGLGRASLLKKKN